MIILTVKQENFNPIAREWLSRSCTSSYTIEMLEDACGKGESSLFNVYQDKAHVASFVLRVDACGLDRELVVVAAGGYLRGASLYKMITPYVESLAASLGADYLRGHCQRAGVGRLMERAGWQQSEIVYRKKVNHGR